MAGHGVPGLGHAAVAGGGACRPAPRGTGRDAVVLSCRRAHRCDRAGAGESVRAAGAGVLGADRGCRAGAVNVGAAGASSAAHHLRTRLGSTLKQANCHASG